nr:hypothetical protein [Tanacetum cinerariifolium]
MAKQQTIKYAPQWNNMTMDNVLGRNNSSTEQMNSIQQLLAYSLITRTEVDIEEIIYSDLITKLLNKSRLKYVSYLRFFSCALQVLLGHDYAQDKKFRGITFMTPNEGITKTTPRPKGSRRDKDSGGNKPSADMEPQNLTDADLSGTGAKYQEDQTHSSRLRAILLCEDEAQENKEDILGAGEEMDDNPQSAETQHQSSPPLKNKQTSSTAPHTETSDTDSSSDKILKKVEKSKLLTEERILVVCVEILARVSKAFVNIIDCRAALFKGADRGFHQLISLISMRNVFIVVIINGGFEAEDQRKLVKATSIIRPDPNEPVRVEFMINGKTVYLTEQEIQEY